MFKLVTNREHLRPGDIIKDDKSYGVVTRSSVEYSVYGQGEGPSRMWTGYMVPCSSLEHCMKLPLVASLKNVCPISKYEELLVYTPKN